MAYISTVTAFIDWDTARRLVRRPPRPSTGQLITVITALQNAIANFLNDIDHTTIYRVQWRIYHGWHRGKTKTDDRALFEKYLLVAKPRTVGKVSFGTDFKFGDILSCDTARNPLYDTLRRNRDTNDLEQKMVDTALVCDLLYLVRGRHSDIYLIVADDDDFVPALFTAESWRAKVMLLHTRDALNGHLRLQGLAERMNPTWI
jgi:hypothetical protein